MEPVNPESLEMCIQAIQSGALTTEQLLGAASQSDTVFGALWGAGGLWLATQGRALVGGSLNGPVGKAITAILFGEWGGARTADGLKAPVLEDGK